MRNDRLLIGDLFAGAGGLSAGFHQQGFDSVFFNEIDLAAAETYRTNFPNAAAFVHPIEELSAEQVRRDSGLGRRELDVMVGGPPCQGFSIYAPVRSQSDPRNHLFRHYIRLVLEGLRPKFIVMENVPGLVSLDDGRTLESVLAAFEQAGYKSVARILNAAHYGVPQERWRLIIIATRLKGMVPSFPAPTHFSIQRPNFTGGRTFTFSDAIGSDRRQTSLFNVGLSAPTTVADAISDLPPIKSGGGECVMQYQAAPATEFQRTIREGSARIYNHICADVAAINLQRVRFVKPGGSWRDIPHDLLPKGLQRARRSDHTRRYGRLDPNGLSCTILTKCDPHWGTFFHYSQDRIISVREAARLQSFPDWFRFTGSKGDQYRQVGNAVPPFLASAIAAEIKSLLSGVTAARLRQKESAVAEYATSRR
jgi:DNA (cytosine-5)-methyltransferase 1